MELETAMKKLSLVSIITVNYNGKKFLKDCFDSLYNLNYPKTKLEIIMVDNGSSDGSVEFVKKNFPKVKIILNDINNYCRANNLGIKMAKGEFIALINNDTKVDRKWLINLIEVMIKDKKIGMAGSKILLMDGTIQNAGHVELPDFYWAERGFGEEKDKYDKMEEMSSLCGASVIFRREVFDKIGLLDEDFVIYFEDVDMATRVKKAGWKVVYIPVSIIYHAFHGTGDNELSQFYIERNRLLYIAKHFPDKLSQALFGKGYFTARQHLENSGKIYQILPEVITKLLKHNKGQDIKNILKEIFFELGKINNSENEFLIKEILAKKENFEKITTTLNHTNSQLAETRSQLDESHSQLNETRSHLDQTRSQLNQTNSQLDKTRFQLQQISKELSSINLSLQDKERESCSVKLDLEQTRKELDKKVKELNGIYTSEGFRFILRPLWTFIWNTRNALRPFIKNIKYSLCLLLSVFLFSLSVSLMCIFLIEHLLWRFIKIFYKEQKFFNNNIEINQKLGISIVIPTYNGLDYLKECLSSIYKTQEFINSNVNEVLVVNDASSDGTTNYLRNYFPRVQIISNERNLGFGKSCNIGIEKAKNEIILLLNNDVIVTEDSLQPLIRHLNNGGVFAVSPKLYAWDRKTFVTGTYIGDFKNGYIHIWNEKDISAEPKVHTSASTMFAVGCAACFRKDCFLAMGGFDPIYEPYCWEDIDISYRALKRGLRVIYDPKSLMFHKMHGTIGPFKRFIEVKNELLFTWKNITDLEKIVKHFLFFPLYFLHDKNSWSILKGYILALRKLFPVLLRRFQERKYHIYTDEELFYRTRQSYNYLKEKKFSLGKPDKPTILFITPFLPYPVKSGGQVRVYNTLKSLADKYNIILVSFIENPNQEQYLVELEKLCRKVTTILRHPSWHGMFDRISLPMVIKYFYSKEMEELIKKCIYENHIDIVQIEYVNMAYYAKIIPDLPKILVEHDASIYTLTNSYERPVFGRIFQFFDWLNWGSFQKHIYSYFDKIVAVSDEDYRIIRGGASRDKISIIPTAVDLTSYKLSWENEKTIDILFLGHMLHYPNIDGLFYFCKKIFPLIKREVPDVNFCIIGSNMSDINLDKIKDKNVHVIGEVEDIRNFLAKTKVLVAPIRRGAGLKIKILEAMAMGVPVVSTSRAVKGIKCILGRDIYVADSPKDFAYKVLDLLKDRQKRIAVAKNARDVVDKYYNANKTAHQIESLYDSLIPLDIRTSEKSLLLIERSAKENKQSQVCVSDIVAGWDIMLHCNYRCPYCFNKGKWEQLEVCNKNYSQEDWLNFWDRIYQKYGEISIIISGGEPFIYPKFLELMRKMVSKHRIEVCTNLSIDFDCIQRIINEFTPQRFILHPSFHPYFADLEEVIKKMHILKHKGWNLEPIIVAYPPMLGELKYFRKRFFEEGIGIFVQPFIGQYQNRIFPQEYMDSEKEIISSFADVDLIRYQLNNISPEAKSCKTGFKYFRVDPDGLILRCASSKKIMGKMEDMNFRLFETAMPCEAEFCMCNNEARYINDYSSEEIGEK